MLSEGCGDMKEDLIINWETEQRKVGSRFQWKRGKVDVGGAEERGAASPEINQQLTIA